MGFTSSPWLKSLFLRFKPKSVSSRNVLKLAGGTAGSQIITVAAMPILTRLYGPESFGLLASFASILALLNVVSSLRYELAIAVPEDDNEAVALVLLCFALVAFSTGLTGLGLLLFGDQLVGWLNEPAFKPLLWLLPVGVFLSGVYQPLSYWTIRCKKFGLLAKTKFRQSIFGVSTNLVSAPLGTTGLLLGQIVSQSAGLGSFFMSFKTQVDLQRMNYIYRLKKAFVKNINYLIFNLPAGLISALHNQLPILLLSSAFETSLLGQFFFAQKLIVLPATVISQSVAQVFLSNAPEKYREGVLHTFIASSAKKLLKYAFASALPLAVFLPWASNFIFGPRWANLTTIIPILIPIYISTLVASPYAMTLVAARKNNVSLLTQLVILVIKILPLSIAINLLELPFYSCLAVFAVSVSFSYIIYVKIVYHVCKN